ncbi:Alpha-tubulin N-acetyltransferase 1 [Mortierella sp. GBA30]|nr:Alpha-tubulin N-acetyltransferase 1 [Mortierella sp. GBA30]
MDFDFPLIPLLPLPITLVPAATFAALENTQQIQPAFASSVSIGLSKNTTVSASSSFSSSSLSNFSSSFLNVSSDQERLGAIVDALGEASAKAQELPTSITQRLRLAKNPTQRVYILRTGLDNGEDQWLDQLEIGSPLMRESIRKSLQDFNGSSDSASQSGSSMSVQEDASRRSQRGRSEEKGVYVAGMLKMGEKRLFIVDKSGILHEQEVCCVLDFYVDESCQRRGFGKLLFDYMLKVENTDPNQIAYDRPSPKLYQFLAKYFGLERHLPQPNQFAIFEGFKLLDCGDTIQVDDDPVPLIPRSTVSVLQQQQQQQHQYQQQPSQPPSQQVNPLIPSQAPNDAKDSTPGSRLTVTSRALQSSVVFSSGPALEPGPIFAASENQITTQSVQQQQPNRRISSAFSSSINLSNPSLVNGPSSTPATTAAITSTTPIQSPSASAQPQAGGSISGSARISRLLASSIVFADG